MTEGQKTNSRKNFKSWLFNQYMKKRKLKTPLKMFDDFLDKKTAGYYKEYVHTKPDEYVQGSAPGASKIKRIHRSRKDKIDLLLSELSHKYEQPPSAKILLKESLKGSNWKNYYQDYLKDPEGRMHRETLYRNLGKDPLPANSAFVTKMGDRGDELVHALNLVLLKDKYRKKLADKNISGSQQNLYARMVDKADSKISENLLRIEGEAIDPTEERIEARKKRKKKWDAYMKSIGKTPPRKPQYIPTTSSGFY